MSSGVMSVPEEKDSEVDSDFEQVDKMQVLQEATRCFMAPSINTKKLVDILTKCIFVMLRGDKLTNTEATDLFFHITRLFQYKDKDNTLRRLTYIGIKALSQQAENVYVVTSSLTTDVNSSRDDPAVRASALRALCQISDASTFTTIERYLKQSIVDKHPVVASAALTSLIRIIELKPEMANHFTSEIQGALNSDSPMVQYHALALGYMVCKNDPPAANRLLSTCVNQGLESPLAICLLLRILATRIENSATNSNDDTKLYTEYICCCLDHPSEMVGYEAANTIVSLINVDTKALKNRLPSVVVHLRNLLSAPKSALRYAAVSLLNKLQDLETTSWTSHRIGSLCRLHLLTKRYRPSEQIIGIIDFDTGIGSNVVCVKYNCILQCEELDEFEMKQEFSLGYKQTNFSLAFPQLLMNHSLTLAPGSTLHCVLSFLFYIANRDHPRSMYEDRAGTIEQGPSELETKIFSCDFPILVQV